MFGFGRNNEPPELQFIRENAVALMSAFIAQLDVALDDLEHFEDAPVLLPAIYDFLAGSVGIAKVIALSESSFAELIGTLPSQKKIQVACEMVKRETDPVSDHDEFPVLATHIVAMVLLQSAGENILDPNELQLAMNMILTSETYR